jgi:hypothetical protein
MNNRIQELQQNLLDIQQRTEKIQIEIRNYQRISTEHLTENGAIKMYKISIKFFILNIYFLEQLNQCLI